MNMLIIGNGFDLAHERPTRYTDFLRFLEYILRARDYLGHRQELAKSLIEVSPTVKEYILNSYDKRKASVSGAISNEIPFVQEIYNCLEQNVWYEYFQKLRVENALRGKNWIDFESEIREVIEAFDRSIEDVYAPLPTAKDMFGNYTDRVVCFFGKLNFEEYNRVTHKPSNYRNTYYDLIEKTYQDLQRLVRCLELYLDDCVKKIPITKCSNDIRDLKIDFVLSFNYTNIPANLYPSMGETIHHIHGNAEANRKADQNNMVLGINEYWENDDKSVHTNFNLYKKFVQRIIKETGIIYKKALNVISSEYTRLKAKFSDYDGLDYNHAYFFGHSLDVTDGDILREIMETPGLSITIFYKDKQQQANQIANLSKILTQDKLLEYAVSAKPKIVFIQQTDMIPVKDQEPVPV